MLGDFSYAFKVKNYSYFQFFTVRTRKLTEKSPQVPQLTSGEAWT